MPHQDSMGRWVSDDGLFYWDGVAWRPIGAQPATGVAPPGMPPQYGALAARRSPWPAIVIGGGIVVLVIIVLIIVFIVVVMSQPEFQRSFCEGYTNNNLNLACPFNVAPASP